MKAEGRRAATQGRQEPPAGARPETRGPAGAGRTPWAMRASRPPEGPHQSTTERTEKGKGKKGKEWEGENGG